MKNDTKAARIRVALVEDDAELRHLFKGWIEASGHLEWWVNLPMGRVRCGTCLTVPWTW